jgi:hypothetical protein
LVEAAAMNADDPTFERVDRPASDGGGYTVTYFSDDKGFPAPRSRATWIEVLCIDAKGRRLGRTYLEKRPARAVDD